ncbi:hypothetical protein C6503_15000 [Candidatus Poribacteria bacterium]|nr:MAG: hypothetical protein C6503_15000 [Candidatus Poribacteria bacterium]
MTRDWKISEPIKEVDQVHCQWTDIILDDKFGITKEDWNTVIEKTVEHVHSWGEQNIARRVSCMIRLLLPQLDVLWQGKVGPNDELSFRWLPCKSLQGATVADHALTASAIAYCIGYDINPRPDIETLDKLRLSALTATWKDDGLEDVYDALWGEDPPIEPKPDGTELEQIVFMAKAVASERTKINDASEFNTHSLNENKQIGLVLGGATKIKGYFLESAKLPEIRGASALLDRINLEDVPALFGREIQDKQRYERIRKGFCKRTGHTLSAPECIIYAAGGNTLAFAPASVVHQIADEIERIYTHETLVANSVAVGDTFDLLELQYGLNPTQFWIGDFQKACEKPETAKIMHTYYGSTDKEDFLERKCFGELTSSLAGAQLKRREGNTTPDRKTHRDLPTHVEIGPYQVRCESCERRPAVINEAKVLCEACTRKYVTGRATKKQLKRGELDHYTNSINKWLPANKGENGEYLLTDWISLYNEYVELFSDVSQNYEQDPDGPNDLNDIAKSSDRENYIAFIYADGNNMGAYLENIETPAQYRQFSERVFVTMQTAAFKALAKLEPVWIKDDNDRYVFPFEIISIGGDDLLLIVPGSKVFEVVHAIGENFDSEFNSYNRLTNTDKLRLSQRYKSSKWVDAQEMQPVFSMSLGFVIAEAHTPVAFLEHLAGSLLKSAKTRAKMLIKDEVGYRGGTVDFLVLKSISMITSNLSDFRKKFYKTDTKNSLTMRPFTSHELSGFIETIKAFKEGKFPQSQLYQLRESLKLGRQTSTLDYLYFRSRLDKKDGEQLQDQIEHNWHSASDKNSNPGPWYAMLQESKTDKTGYETLLFDLIEAYDFILDPEKQNEEDNSDESND